MVYNFRIVSDEVDRFKREIQIDADDTFLDFKNAICDSVGYDKNQMDSFFICDKNWEKEKEITFEDMDFDSTIDDPVLMDDAILSDYLEDEGDRLMYVFDYGYERAFFIELKEITTGKTLKDPLCTLALGKAPEQIKELDPDIDIAHISTSPSIDDLDEDFEGSEIGDDDLDPERFYDDTESSGF